MLNADPHRDPIRLELGDCLLRLNRLEPALDCFDQCWSDGAQRQALFGKGVALQLLRRFDEAEVAYERLLALDGKAEEALANLIAMSMEVFDLERVRRYSRRLVEINPRSVRVCRDSPWWRWSGANGNRRAPLCHAGGTCARGGSSRPGRLRRRYRISCEPQSPRPS